MHHLAAVAVSDSTSSDATFSSAQMDVHLHDNSVEKSSVPRHLPDIRCGVGATSLITDGAPLNHDISESEP